MQAHNAALDQEGAKRKLGQYRASAVTGDDAMYDAERGVFHFHGKHVTLVGVEAVVTVDLPSMLLAMSVVIQNTVVPVLLGQLEVKVAARPDAPAATGPQAVK